MQLQHSTSSYSTITALFLFHTGDSMYYVNVLIDTSIVIALSLLSSIIILWYIVPPWSSLQKEVQSDDLWPFWGSEAATYVMYTCTYNYDTSSFPKDGALNLHSGEFTGRERVGVKGLKV